LTKRLTYSAKLEAIYSKMELYIISNEIPIDRNLNYFLRIHKNLIVNPGYLDIKVINVLNKLTKPIEAEKNRFRYKKVIESLPNELVSLSNEFEIISSKSIRHSMLRWDNLHICIFCSIVVLIDYSFSKGGRLMKSIKDFSEFIVPKSLHPKMRLNFDPVDFYGAKVAA